MNAPRFLSLTAAAELLGMSERALRARVFRQQVPVVRIVGRVFFDRLELERWIRQHTVLATDHRADVVAFPAEPRNG